MTNKRTERLYGGKVIIDFYPDSHRYKLQGRNDYLISATAATGVIDKSRFLIPWAVNTDFSYFRQYLENANAEKFSREEILMALEEAQKQHEIRKQEAASVGSLVHKFAEDFSQAKINNQEMPEISEDLCEQAINGISAFLDWYNGHNINFLDCEKLLYSRKNDFAGLTDAVVDIDGRKILLDYKTGKGIYSEHYYQVAGYRLAYEEENGKLDGAMILHFDKETGNFNIKEISNKDHKINCPVFLACLAIKKREKEMSKI